MSGPPSWVAVLAALCVPFSAAAETPCSHELVYEPYRGLVLVQVSVGESPPLDWVLDSGSNVSAITDRNLAAALELSVSGRGLARGMGRGATSVDIVRGATLRAGGVDLLTVDLAVHHLTPLLSRQADREIHGLLGWELFDRYAVEIDPSGSRLLLHEPGSARDTGGRGVRLKVQSRRAIVEARLVTSEGRRVKVRLLVDTGSGGTLTLIDGSARHLEAPRDARRESVFGIGGEVPTAHARVESLELGPVSERDLEATYVQRSSIPAALALPSLNGVLGNGFLSRYRTVIDYRGGELILRRREEPL